MQELLKLSNRVADLERRFSQSMRPGTVSEVNPAEGWCRMNFAEGDDGPMLSAKMPYTQMAGAVKGHIPVSNGQQMMMIAPAGDLAQAIAIPMTWSNQNASPGSTAEENVITFGGVTIRLKGDALSVSVGGVTWTLSGDGETTTGGMVKHNEHDIGDTHLHRDTMPLPGALSGPPQ